MMKNILYVLLIMILAGCAQVKPNDPNEYKQAVRKTIHQSEKIVFVNTSDWFPNQYGYQTIMNGTAVINQGVIALTEKSIYFLVWLTDKRNYITSLKISYVDIPSIEMVKLGMGKVIVIHDKDHHPQTFAIISGFSNREITDNLYAMIQDRINVVE